MDEWVLSLLVFVGIFFLVVGLLIAARRAVRAREEGLSAYCREKGYRLEMTKEPTAQRVVIEGECWRFESSMVSVPGTANAGSSDWRSETEWIADVQNPLRPAFALQVGKGTANLDALPAWVRESALAAMREKMDIPAELKSVRSALCENGRCGVVFECAAGEASEELERLRAPVFGLKAEETLYLICSPARVKLTLPGAVVRNAEEVEALLCVGRALL